MAADSKTPAASSVTEIAAVPAAASAPPPSEGEVQSAIHAEPTLHLDEACERLSRDGRVELMAAFYADEFAADRLIGTEAEYRTRLATFAARPA